MARALALCKDLIGWIQGFFQSLGVKTREKARNLTVICYRRTISKWQAPTA